MKNLAKSKFVIATTVCMTAIFFVVVWLDSSHRKNRDFIESHTPVTAIEQRYKKLFDYIELRISESSDKAITGTSVHSIKFSTELLDVALTVSDVILCKVRGDNFHYEYRYESCDIDILKHGQFFSKYDRLDLAKCSLSTLYKHDVTYGNCTLTKQILPRDKNLHFVWYTRSFKLSSGRYSLSIVFPLNWDDHALSNCNLLLDGGCK